MKIRFLGAARKVTGSCFHLLTDGTQVLVDCGMNQGRNSDALNREPFRFHPDQIDTLLLTHAHLDHSGLIPRLAAGGFPGRILTTSATAELAEIILLDSAHIQEKDAEWQTKKAQRAGKDQVFEPLYTTEDVRACLPYFDQNGYDSLHQLPGGMRFRFVDAGHILGSASLELWFRDGGRDKKIVFSGDIGKNGNPIIRDPQHITEADYVVIESTYGNRFHKDLEASIEELAKAVKETFKRGGNVLLPSFAVGRTQDVLYILDRLVKEGALKDLDV